MPRRAATNSLERALILLELLAGHPGGLTNAEISRQLDIATSTSSYILRRLARAGFVRLRSETRKYEIGLRVVTLAESALEALGLREAVKPLLHKLKEQTRLAAVVAVLDRGRALVVERLETPELSTLKQTVGARMPVHSTALGKVLVADLPEEQLDQIFSRQGMPRLSPTTIVSRKRFVQELDKVRRLGYAVAEEENEVGVRAVAAPIVDPAGIVIAAVSAAGLITQSAWDDPTAVVDLVKQTARDISRRVK